MKLSSNNLSFLREAYKKSIIRRLKPSPGDRSFKDACFICCEKDAIYLLQYDYKDHDEVSAGLILCEQDECFEMLKLIIA